MYFINLIHEKIVPISQQRTRLSLRLLYVLAWLITGVVMAYFFTTTQADIDSIRAGSRLLEARNELPSDLTMQDVLSLEQRLQASKAILSRIHNQGLLWAPKLKSLRVHLPKDAWLNRLSCRRSTTAFATPPSGGGLRQPPRPLGEFVIEGMVLIPEGAAGSESLEEFVAKLKNDKTFMEKISNLNHLVIGRERYGVREIATFVIVCVIDESVRLDA